MRLCGPQSSLNTIQIHTTHHCRSLLPSGAPYCHQNSVPVPWPGSVSSTCALYSAKPNASPVLRAFVHAVLCLGCLVLNSSGMNTYSSLRTPSNARPHGATPNSLSSRDASHSLSCRFPPHLALFSPKVFSFSVLHETSCELSCFLSPHST